MTARPDWWNDNHGDVRVFVVPWSGEVVAPPEAPPIVIPDIPPPPLPTPELPELPDPFPIIVHKAHYLWDDVWQWQKSYLSTLWSGATKSVNILRGDAESVALNAISVSQTAWSSFVGHLENWITTGLGDITDTLGTMVYTMVALYYDAIAQADNVFTGLVGYINSQDAMILATVANVVGLLEALPQAIIQDLQTWVIQDVYIPLDRQIVGDINATNNFFGSAVTNLNDRLTQLEKIDVPKLTAEVAVLIAAVTALRKWVDDCGEPMCESMGPNTDLGKWLKALEALLGLLAGIGLANLTEADLYKLAGFFQAITTGTVDDFVNAFAAGGETLGSAGGALLGDLGDIAGKAFAEVTGL